MGRDVELRNRIPELKPGQTRGISRPETKYHSKFAPVASFCTHVKSTNECATETCLYCLRESNSNSQLIPVWLSKSLARSLQSLDKEWKWDISLVQESCVKRVKPTFTNITEDQLLIFITSKYSKSQAFNSMYWVWTLTGKYISLIASLSAMTAWMGFSRCVQISPIVSLVTLSIQILH